MRKRICVHQQLFYVLEQWFIWALIN